MIDLRPAGFERLLRFLAVGGAATLLYAVLATLAHLVLPGPAALTSLMAYGGAALLSYHGHKAFTFENRAPHATTAPRFAVTSLIGYGLAVIIPLIVTDGLGMSAHLSTLLICLAIPGLNFLLLSRLVFGTRSHATRL